MTHAQNLFCLTIGVALAGVGSVFATANVADWGLAWVGALVIGITLVYRWRPVAVHPANALAHDQGAR